MSKKKSPKLPKTIGGVKIPKELRKAGGALLAKADSPAGREMLAAGLTMAATGLAAAATAAADRRRAGPFAETPPTPPFRPAPPIPPVPPAPPHQPGRPGVADPQALADAIGDAVDAALARVFGGRTAR